MTGFRHHSFNYDCTRKGCYHETLPLWDYLDGVFPRGILPTDIDGMVEVNGHILFIEQKSPGVSLKRGQALAFQALSRLPNVRVAVIRPGDASEMQLNVLNDGKGTGFQDVTHEDYVEFLRSWADMADSTPADATELARLRRDNEMLRRQVQALIESAGAA